MKLKSLLKKFDINLQSGIIYFALAGIWIFFSILTDWNFLTARNLSNIVRTVAPTAILACSTVLIIVSGGIDLSAGYAAMFSGILAAILMTQWGVSIPLTIIIVLVMGILVGLLNGAIIAYTGLAPFIITLATQMLFFGFAYIACGGFAIAPLPDEFNVIGQAYIGIEVGMILGAVSVILLFFYKFHARKEQIRYGFEVDTVAVTIIKWAITSFGILLFVYIMNSYRGIPIPVLILIIIAMLLSFIANKTTWGRSIYAIGGNREAAHYSGIKVKRNWMFVFMLQSMMAVVAGLILAARVNSGNMSTGNNLHLDAIAGAVIGGTSMRGGVGKVPGAILGAVFMVTIDNGMSMLNVGVEWQYIVKAVVLLAAVISDSLSRGRKTK
ncbi:MAG: sugar ABC transporter permease [Christensenellales bacterium]